MSKFILLFAECMVIAGAQFGRRRDECAIWLYKILYSFNEYCARQVNKELICGTKDWWLNYRQRSFIFNILIIFFIFEFEN